MQKIAFIIPPTVELLDLSGPAQVFTETKVYGDGSRNGILSIQREPHQHRRPLGSGEIAILKRQH